MGDKIGGVAWCSSGIIFGSCFDGDLWLGQVKCLLFSIMLENLEAGNHHHQVLQLEPFEVWQHSELVLVLGSEAFLPVLVIPIIMLFTSLFKLCILFLSIVLTLVIVAGVLSG